MPPKPRPHGKRKPRAAAVPKAPATTGGRDNRLIAMLALGGVALLAVIGIGAALAFGGDDETPDARAALEAAGCTFSATPALRGAHSITTPEGTSKAWNTTPPTSGPHYEVPAVWGTYDDTVNQAQLVHNLEHGGVAIQYGSGVPAETVQSLKGFVRENSRGTVLAQYPSLGDKIALGAWVLPNPEDASNLGTAYLAKCPDFDEAAFAAFFDAYQFQGTERFPPDMLLPGRT
jgi:hypothetical protein